MKVTSIVGARPQFIKAAPVDRELRKSHNHVLVHTGQHYDYTMSAVFFEELGIPEPDYNLGVGSASHGTQTGQMLIRLEETLVREEPDCVLVYGDTNSTLAGALAAAKLHVPVAHVEAGLRSFNKSMPEEINRLLTDHMADLLFCPTETARRNLLREGITEGVFHVGDVMYDALLHSAAIVNSKSRILGSLDLEPGSYLLLTIHRPGNTDDPQNLSNILEALNEIEEKIVFPAHPRTSQAIDQINWRLSSTVQLIGPVSYLDMLALERNARLIVTDSGGVQKEAYLFGVPCITLRRETEWVETVEAGWNILTGPSKEKIIRAVEEFRPDGKRPEIFGDGMASEKIAHHLGSIQQP